MTTPTWLLDHLIRAGHVTETGATRKAKIRRCQKCRAHVLVGLDADMCALEVEADPTPLSALGEALALVEGRRTLALYRDRGRFVLDPRRTEDITGDPAGSNSREDALREHRCSTFLTDPLTAPSAFAVVWQPPLPTNAVPTF